MEAQNKIRFRIQPGLERSTHCCSFGSSRRYPVPSQQSGGRCMVRFSWLQLWPVQNVDVRCGLVARNKKKETRNPENGWNWAQQDNHHLNKYAGDTREGKQMKTLSLDAAVGRATFMFCECGCLHTQNSGINKTRALVGWQPIKVACEARQTNLLETKGDCCGMSGVKRAAIRGRSQSRWREVSLNAPRH